jgi:hypothetical protein
MGRRLSLHRVKWQARKVHPAVELGLNLWRLFPLIKHLAPFALSILLAAPALAQRTPSATELATPQVPSGPGYLPPGKAPVSIAPFSSLAVGGGISTMGINLQAAVMVARHFNVRGTGNFFNYTDSNISTHGFNVDAKLNFAAAAGSLDYFPWANHGLRLSAGALFYNQNALSATMTAAGGTSFTLNSVTYYSSKSNPVQGTGSLGLHTQNPAPTASIGWGNMIPRNGGHWSFPVEVGAAYTGEPALAIALTSGQVCSNPQGTINCQNVVGNANLNSNLQAQIAKDKKDLSPLRFYPIVSFGVSYSFGGRTRAQ